MHKLYLSKYEPTADNTYIVKELLYQKILNQKFNLEFGYPRSDTCQLCDKLTMASFNTCEIQRNELSIKLAEHQLKASQAYQLLQNDTDL